MLKISIISNIDRPRRDISGTIRCSPLPRSSKNEKILCVIESGTAFQYSSTNHNLPTPSRPIFLPIKVVDYSCGTAARQAPGARPSRVTSLSDYGHDSNVSRGKRKKSDQNGLIPSILESDESCREYRRNWARLIQKIYETDPLCCPKARFG